jgi:Flp pilus assembly pilin Flp
VDRRRIRGTGGVLRARPRGLDAPSRLRRLMHGEQGAATAEYAVATLAAVGFAGLLVVIMRSDEVRQMLTDVVRTALTLPG